MTIDNPATTYIEWLKASLHLDTDEQVAEYLGVSRKTISSWRTRGNIPAKVLIKFQKPAAQMGLQIGDSFSVNSKVLETVAMGIFLFLRDKYRDKIGARTSESAYTFWASEYPRIREIILEHFSGLDLHNRDAVGIISDHIWLIEKGELFNIHKIIPYDRIKDLSP